MERDRLGEVQVPTSVYWGAQTLRAREHFAGVGQKPHHRLIEALAAVKKAAALTNADLGLLDPVKGRAIAQACDEMLNGQWKDQFVADMFQSGAGISLNTNMNEVIANRAAEMMGGSPGSYDLIKPDEHVNLGQSANDAFTSAARIACVLLLRDIEPILLDMERLLRRKALEFERVIKVGRAHLQDTAPITMGQEFNAFGASIERAHRRIKDSSSSLLELNIGATYVGTGLGTDPTFGIKCVERLTAQIGVRFKVAEDLFRVTQSMADFVELSSSLRELAVELNKISCDMRLLSSGPRGGLGELMVSNQISEATPLAAGSSDRINPNLAECLNMVCLQIMGNDLVVSLAAQFGQLDNNPFTPLIAHNILQSVEMFKCTIGPFNHKFLAGLRANTQRCRELVEESNVIVAALAVKFGAARSKEFVRDAALNGQRVKDYLLEKSLLSEGEFEQLLNARTLTSPGRVSEQPGDHGTIPDTN